MYKNLANFNTEIFVTSTIYFTRIELEKFVQTFTSIEIVDNKLNTYVQILKEILKSHGFDNLPTDPEMRKAKIIGLIRARLQIIPQAIHRDECLKWFNSAIQKDYDIELYKELLYRYCWAEFMDRVTMEDKAPTNFSDKLAIKPKVPQLTQEVIRCIGDIEDEATETQEIFKTGLKELDSILFMRRTNFVVVAARTSVGKSLFMINQAVYSAKCDKKVLYVSLEESDTEVKKRILLHLHGSPKSDIDRVNKNLFVYSPSVSAPDSIFTKVDEVINKYNIGAIFFDYLQLMKYPNMKDFDSLRELTRELKLYATSRNVLVVTASQLKRETEFMGASLTGLFGSSTIEADANAILLLDRKRNGNRIEHKAPISIDIAKNRSGEVKKLDNIIVDYSNGHIGAEL